MNPPVPPEPATLSVQAALHRLREAQDDHDTIRRDRCAGAVLAQLSADTRRWEALGQAVADLAASVARQCAASHFCPARPDVLLLAVRLSESIDDLMDEPAWIVLDAAARVAAAGRP